MIVNFDHTVIISITSIHPITMQNTLFQTFKSVAEQLVPITTTSTFHSTGTITPDEFIQSCDTLIQQCSSWQWCQLDDTQNKYKQSYLQDNKQYIICRNMPSYQRVKLYAKQGQEEIIVENDSNNNDIDDGWLTTHNDDKNDIIKTQQQQQQLSATNNISTVDITNTQANNNDNNSATSMQLDNDDNDEIPDMQLIDTNNTNNNNNTTLTNNNDAPQFDSNTYLRAVEPNDDNTDILMNHRSYDISIVYDRYYRTPRVYLFGYDSNHMPLSMNDIMDDISSDYVYQTVTVEKHPYTQIPTVSIHPCRHAQTMKNIVDTLQQNIDSNGKNIQVDVKYYMLIFLKFIASVIPTIQYDYTQAY